MAADRKDCPKENVIIIPDSQSAELFVFGIKVLCARQYSQNLSEETRKGQITKALSGTTGHMVFFGGLHDSLRRSIVVRPTRRYRALLSRVSPARPPRLVNGRCLFGCPAGLALPGAQWARFARLSATISLGSRSLRTKFSCASPRAAWYRSTTVTGTSAHPRNRQASRRRCPAISRPSGVTTIGCSRPTSPMLAASVRRSFRNRSPTLISAIFMATERI